jgi:cellulose synthase/poly-beta-1,6-N-acetylglucosamine synthase-like glycosyltransferase
VLQVLEVLPVASGLLTLVVLLANNLVLVAAALSRARPYEVGDDLGGSYGRVTLVVPAYREGDTIHFLLTSLRDIDYDRGSLKLIIVGEEDDRETYDAVSRVCRVDGEVLDCYGIAGRYLVNRSGMRGKAVALSYALRYVDTEYVAVYDAEDTVHPKHFKVALRVLSDSSVAAVQFVRRVVARYRTVEKAQEEDFNMYYTRVQPFMSKYFGLAELGGSAFLIKTECLRAVGGVNPRAPTEDLDLTYRLASRGWRVLVALPPSETRSITTLGSLIKQRSRWIRGGILAIPLGIRALPRSLPLLIVTGITPLSTVTSTVMFVALLVDLVVGLYTRYLLYILVTLVVLSATSTLTSLLLLGNPVDVGKLKYIAVMSAVYYLATWRALLDILRAPYSWDRSESKLGSR